MDLENKMNTKQTGDDNPSKQNVPDSQGCLQTTSGLLSPRTQIRKETIRELKARMKREMETKTETAFCPDEYETAASCATLIKKSTGLIFDHKMTLHKCEWDSNYPAKPERYFAILDRLHELNLIERCTLLNPVKATIDQVALKHDKNLYLKLQKICEEFDLLKLENEASNYDAIYFNNNTFEAALLASGSVISLVENICNGHLKNGMAVVRPPGHHAMHNEYCGYCYFNNVAIAAQYALNNNLAKRILIVDYDVHHGQGTQRMFYEDDRVLYFSIHRYENGLFWPNLRESNFDYIGSDKGIGYNINCPLNEIRLGDNEYMSIVLNILLPVAYEYQPDLIIISAGYDACVGCAEGLMEVTPGFYGHLIKLLSGLAHGKIAVCLEGGYFLPSLAEGSSMTLKALLDDPPAVLPSLKQPHPCVIEMINNIIFMLKPYWKCFNLYQSYDHKKTDTHHIRVLYYGNEPKPPYDTRNCYPEISPQENIKCENTVFKLRKEYSCLKPLPVAYTYNIDMLLHKSRGEHPEKPDRLKAVYNRFVELNLKYRCKFVPAYEMKEEYIEYIHDKQYIQKLKIIKSNKEEVNSRDVYINNTTYHCALLSVKCLLGITSSVLSDICSSGAAFIRPPGHHAEHGEAKGFCIFNNVAIAAHYIINEFKVNRVLILDFDIHHGNGTQKIFYDNDKVLYISVHRYDNGNFYPKGEDGNYDKVGENGTEGYNVNIPLNQDKMTDIEYLTIFFKIILPIAYAFAPEVVLVSAGFDAGVNDNLGGYKLTPESFGHFIQLLKPLAGGKIILTLEGGYNVTTLAHGMNICVKTLLGDPVPMLANTKKDIYESAKTSIKAVINTQKKYWPVLDIVQKLPNKVSLLEENIDGTLHTIHSPTMDMLNKHIQKY